MKLRQVWRGAQTASLISTIVCLMGAFPAFLIEPIFGVVVALGFLLSILVASATWFIALFQD